MQTYFLIRASVLANEYEFGPYVHFGEAAELFVDHLRDLLSAKEGYYVHDYTARIDEIVYSTIRRDEFEQEYEVIQTKLEIEV